MRPAPIAQGPPLCVPLEGTLVRTNLFLECALNAIRARPSLLLQLPRLATRGRAAAIEHLAGYAPLDPATLPYNREAVMDLGRQAAEGRQVMLLSSAGETLGKAVADHLGFVNEVLVEGDWRPGPDGVQEYVPRKATPSRLRAVIRLLRPYQWLKNTLIFFPFLLAHEGRNLGKWGLAILAFIAFSFTASCGYVINDVLDRAQDRQHPRRRHRPVASGNVPLEWALFLPLPLLAGAGFAVAFLPPVCAAILLWYLGATSAYSWVLKNRLMADVITLALLYTCRLFMGANATSNVISPWLAAFSLCIFLSLALCKRVSELMTWKSLKRDDPPGRKYRSDDIPLLETMAVSSGFLGCLVAVFYVQSSDILLLYRHPQYLWIVVIALLYWITRLIIYTHRGKCPEDPIFFVLQDRTTLIVLTIAAGVVLLAV